MNEGMHLTLEAVEAITTKKNGMMRTVIGGEEMVGSGSSQAPRMVLSEEYTVCLGKRVKFLQVDGKISKEAQ